MKRMITCLLAVVMMFTLAACGENNESNSPPLTSGESSATATPGGGDNGNSAENPDESTNPDDNSPVKTKEEFLSWFGLKEDDVKPSGFINLDIYGCTTKEGTIYIQIDEASGVSENVQAWAERIYDKLKQVSDDGKIYESFALDKEYKLPNSYGNSVYLTWVYRYGGKSVMVQCNFDPFGFSLSKNEIKKISAYEIILAME